MRRAYGALCRPPAAFQESEAATGAGIRRLAPTSHSCARPAMDKLAKPSPADVAAEVNHFRSEAIRQELASGESSGTTVDRVAAENLPGNRPSPWTAIDPPKGPYPTRN